MFDDTVIAIVSVSLVFGAPMLWLIIDTIAKNWRKVRIAEQNTALKRDLLAQGYTPDEVIRLVTAGTEKIAAGREVQRPARCHR